MTSLSSQRTPRAAAEKARLGDTPGGAPAAGGAIRGSRCGAVAGSALHGPMT